MNPEERIEMNQDERDRLHWLKQVKDKKLTQKKAAELMKVSPRWVRKLVKKMKRKGEAELLLTRPRQGDPAERGPRSPRQIGRGLQQLGITWIGAHSPQAKGRIERFFGTAQDRLVLGMSDAGVATLEEANRYLEETF